MNPDTAPKKNIEQKKIESILDLPDQEKKMERARLLLGLTVTDIVIPNAPHTPVRLKCNVDQAIALLDKLKDVFPIENLSIILTSQTPGLKANKELVAKISDGTALRVIGGKNKETAIIAIGVDSSTLNYKIEFGYSNKGTGIEKAQNGSLNIILNQDKDLIVMETLIKLFELTSDTSYLNYLATRTKVAAGSRDKMATKQIDVSNFYSTLGLDPNILNLISEDEVTAMVKGVKIALVKKLHPDNLGRQLNKFELERFEKINLASEYLSDPEQRRLYTNWL